MVVWETVLFEDGLGSEGERHREDPWRRERQIMVRVFNFYCWVGRVTRNNRIIYYPPENPKFLIHIQPNGILKVVRQLTPK